jgi:Amt family ammonium transporter
VRRDYSDWTTFGDRASAAPTFTGGEQPDLELKAHRLHIEDTNLETISEKDVEVIGEVGIAD